MLRHIGERAVPIIAIKDVAIDSRHVQVGPAVIVEISCSDPHGVTLSFEARALRYFSERAILIVSVETVVECGIVLFQAGNSSAVCEEEVEESVIVEVEECDPAKRRID